MTQRDNAFSLIELLVVVSIIAVIAALMLPTISLVRDSARTAACANNLRQIGVSLMAYGNDNSGLLVIRKLNPDPGSCDAEVTASFPAAWSWYTGQSGVRWIDEALMGSVCDELKQSNYRVTPKHSIWTCPAGGREARDPGNNYIWGYGLTFWFPWIQMRDGYEVGRPKDAFGYASNVSVSWAVSKRMRWDNIPQPANAAMATDVTGDYAGCNITSNGSYPAVLPSQLTPSSSGNLVFLCHRGGSNVLFGDLSVRYSRNLLAEVAAQTVLVRP